MIQTLLGMYQLKVLLMEYTNSIQILYNDIVFILQDEMLRITNLFINDVLVLRLKTRYKRANELYKTILTNLLIQHFVYKHLSDLNRVF